MQTYVEAGTPVTHYEELEKKHPILQPVVKTSNVT